MAKKLPALKPNKYGTISRSSLLKYVKAGLVEAKCDYHYTDDYAYDNASGFGQTDWKPARIKQNHTDHVLGTISFDQDDFSSTYKTGYAQMQNDGLIRFNIHSNLSYSMRIKNNENDSTKNL